VPSPSRSLAHEATGESNYSPTRQPYVPVPSVPATHPNERQRL